MRVNETFYSIQGEGPQIGMPALFIRLAGCNLDCSYCDSKYAKEGKTNLPALIVNETLNGHQCKNVVITGGEPMIQHDLLTLLKLIRNKGGIPYVETNGTIFDSMIIGFANFIVSPKLQYMNENYLKVLKKWQMHATFKFVIGSRREFDEAVQLCKDIDKLDDVYFMPKGIDDKKLKDIMISMVEWIKEDAPFVRLSPRLQIHLYGNKRGV